MKCTRLRSIVTVLAAFCAFGGLAAAQQSAFQTGNGRTSLYLRGATAATLNFGETKASFGSSWRWSDKPVAVGYEVFAKASSGVTTLFSSKINVPEGGGSFLIGWYPKLDLDSPPPESGSTKYQWALVDLGYSRSSFFVANAAVAPDQAKRYFNRFRFIGAYNRVAGRFAFGMASGAERRNNLDSLRPVTFETTILPAPAGGATAIVKTQSGFLGSYGEYIAAPLYTDIVYLIPKLTAPGFKDTAIAIDGFTRSDIAATHRLVDGGAGLFITKANAPTHVYGGITCSWNEGKVKVAVVASYVF